MPPAAFLHPGGAYSAPQTPSWIKGPTSKGRGEEGSGERAGEGKDFGPSQCWRQIDAPGTLLLSYAKPEVMLFTDCDRHVSNS